MESFESDHMSINISSCDPLGALDVYYMHLEGRRLLLDVDLCSFFKTFFRERTVILVILCHRSAFNWLLLEILIPVLPLL